MQAVILAGGLGTRLRPITERVPKPMVPVAGKPYLEHQILWLARQRVTDIVLLTGYLGEQIEAYFGGGQRLGVSLRYSREETPLGTGGALRHALPLLADVFVALNGDSFLPIEYAPVEAALDDSADGVLAVYDNALEDTGVIHNIAAEGGLVTRYEKGAGLSYVDAGVIALRRSALALCENREVFSLENDVYRMLIARRRLKALPVRQRFYDMGTPRGLTMLEAYLSR